MGEQELEPEALRAFFEKELSVLEELEVIDPGWRSCRSAMVRSLRDLFGEANASEKICEYQKEWGTDSLRRLYAYFIYVYLAGAVYDDDMNGKLFFASFCTKWVHLLWLSERYAQKVPLSRETMAVLASRLAREVEHDDDNFCRIEEAI